MVHALTKKKKKTTNMSDAKEKTKERKQIMHTYVVCYTLTENHQTGFAICHEPNEWLYKPNATVNYIFDANASIGLNDFSENRFKRYAEQYGINPTAYGAIIKGTTEYNLQLMDIQPKNRKYPIIAINMTTHKLCKCTTEFIKRRLTDA